MCSMNSNNIKKNRHFPLKLWRRKTWFKRIVECHYYAPNFEEVDGAYWFRVLRLCLRASVCSSRTVHARVLKFHMWIPHGKIFDAHFFFSCRSYLPFWSYAPLNKIRMKSDACNILWTMHARVLKFHIWIPHGKIADPCFFFFLFELPPFLELCPFEKIRMNSCQQNISKSIWARGLKLGQLIGDDE